MALRPGYHQQARGIHPGAFVQATAPDTSGVQDGVLWVDTSTPEPFALKVWDQINATWRLVGVGGAPGPAGDAGNVATLCLTFTQHGASICNDTPGVLALNTPGARHAVDSTGYELPGGHRLEAVPG